MILTVRGARSPWRLNYVQWSLVFVSPKYGTFFTPTFWCSKFVAPFSENHCSPVDSTVNINRKSYRHWKRKVGQEGPVSNCRPECYRYINMPRVLPPQLLILRNKTDTRTTFSSCVSNSCTSEVHPTTCLEDPEGRVWRYFFFYGGYRWGWLVNATPRSGR